MLKAFLSFLALAVVLVTVSFAGLAYTGMASMDSMNHGSLVTMSHAMNCQGGDCLSPSPITADAACLDHCLSIATRQTSAVTPLSLSLITLVVFVLLLVFSQLPATFDLLTPAAWREGIGKLFHKRELATVLIRD